MRRLSLARPVLLLGLTVALLIVGDIVLPGFVSLGQIANQLKIASFLGLFGLCQAIVIAAGGQGLDLSVGAVASLGGILGAALMAGSNLMTPVGALAAIGAGLGVGFLNGVGIAVLGVPPLVITLALSSVVNGGLIIGVSLTHPADFREPRAGGHRRPRCRWRAERGAALGGGRGRRHLAAVALGMGAAALPHGSQPGDGAVERRRHRADAGSSPIC